MAKPAIGTEIGGRYHVTRVDVDWPPRGHLARDLETGAECCVVLEPELPSEAYARAVALRGLKHPHVTPLLEVGRTADDEAFLVWELVDRAPLAELLGRGARLDARGVVAITVAVCDAVEAMRGRGVDPPGLTLGTVVLDVPDQRGVEVFGVLREPTPNHPPALGVRVLLSALLDLASGEVSSALPALANRLDLTTVQAIRAELLALVPEAAVAGPVLEVPVTTTTLITRPFTQVATVETPAPLPTKTRPGASMDPVSPPKAAAGAPVASAPVASAPSQFKRTLMGASPIAPAATSAVAASASARSPAAATPSAPSPSAVRPPPASSASALKGRTLMGIVAFPVPAAPAAPAAPVDTQAKLSGGAPVSESPRDQQVKLPSPVVEARRELTPRAGGAARPSIGGGRTLAMSFSAAAILDEAQRAATVAPPTEEPALDGTTAPTFDAVSPADDGVALDGTTAPTFDAASPPTEPSLDGATAATPFSVAGLLDTLKAPSAELLRPRPAAEVRPASKPPPAWESPSPVRAAPPSSPPPSSPPPSSPPPSSPPPPRVPASQPPAGRAWGSPAQPAPPSSPPPPMISPAPLPFAPSSANAPALSLPDTPAPDPSYARTLFLEPVPEGAWPPPPPRAQQPARFGEPTGTAPLPGGVSTVPLDPRGVPPAPHAHPHHHDPYAAGMLPPPAVPAPTTNWLPILALVLLALLGASVIGLGLLLFA